MFAQLHDENRDVFYRVRLNSLVLIRNKEERVVLEGREKRNEVSVFKPSVSAAALYING